IITGCGYGHQRDSGRLQSCGCRVHYPMPGISYDVNLGCSIQGYRDGSVNVDGRGCTADQGIHSGNPECLTNPRSEGYTDESPVNIPGGCMTECPAITCPDEFTDVVCGFGLCADFVRAEV